MGFLIITVRDLIRSFFAHLQSRQILDSGAAAQLPVCSGSTPVECCFGH
jgi:hypothetical protein